MHPIPWGKPDRMTARAACESIMNATPWQLPQTRRAATAATACAWCVVVGLALLFMAAAAVNGGAA